MSEMCLPCASGDHAGCLGGVCRCNVYWREPVKPTECVWREAPRDRVVSSCQPERWFDRMFVLDFANCPYCGKPLRFQFSVAEDFKQAQGADR